MKKKQEVAPTPEVPEVWGMGISPVKDGGFVVHRVSNRGAIEVLTPKRNGEYSGEQKVTALARLRDAMEQEFVFGRVQREKA